MIAKHWVGHIKNTVTLHTHHLRTTASSATISATCLLPSSIPYAPAHSALLAHRLFTLCVAETLFHHPFTQFLPLRYGKFYWQQLFCPLHYGIQSLFLLQVFSTLCIKVALLLLEAQEETGALLF